MPVATESDCIEILPDNIPLELVKVAGGSFEMGSNKYDSEQPIHKVSVRDFFIGKYPVTNAQYAIFLNDYGSDKVQRGENEGQRMIYEHRWGVQPTEEKWQAAKGFEQHPIINVTWYGAEEFCQWLSKRTGKRYRLPSEAKWEYAARGRNQSLGFRYSGSNKLKEVGWYRVNSMGGTKAVGLKFPNELGIYDMSGNVREWCADHWHGDYKGAPDDGSPWVIGGDKDLRVVRGGSWYVVDFNCRVSNRFRVLAVGRSNSVGFRVVR